MNITNDALPVIHMDARYNAFHYRAVKFLMPLNIQHEAKSAWYSQIPVMMKAELMFPGQIVVHTSVVSVNLKHREYKRGLKKDILNLVRHEVHSEIPEEYRQNSLLLAWNDRPGDDKFLPPAVCFPPLQPHKEIEPYTTKNALLYLVTSHIAWTADT